MTPPPLVSESVYEDEEEVARGAGSPGEAGIDEEIDTAGEGSADFSLRMGTNATRAWDSGAGGGFVRGVGHRVSFDPEAPPLPPLATHQQTTCLLEKPEPDKKVKVSQARYLATVLILEFVSLKFISEESDGSRPNVDFYLFGLLLSLSHLISKQYSA